MIYTVRLGKMAQHARHWALFMAKLKVPLQNASNMVSGNALDYNISKFQLPKS